MKSWAALRTLAVTACYLIALTRAMAVVPTEPTKPSSTEDSTRSSTGRNLFVHPHYKTSPQTVTTTRQPQHGQDPDVAEPRPFPPPPPPPRRFRPGARLRRPGLTKAMYPPFHVYSAHVRGLVPHSAPDPNTSTDTDHSKAGMSSSMAHVQENASTLVPGAAEPSANRTLATNVTAMGDQETSPAATVLSASTIWTLVLCATMIVAAFIFFAVVLAVCRCRQRRERRKKYLTTQKNIQVMQNMVKIAARKKKETARQGPFGRSSIG